MKIVFNEMTFEILEVEDGNEKLFAGESERFATFHPVEQTIYLAKSAKKEKKRAMILHELTHAYMFATGLDYGLEPKEWEEGVCDFIAYHSRHIFKAYNKYCQEFV